MPDPLAIQPYYSLTDPSTRIPYIKQIVKHMYVVMPSLCHPTTYLKTKSASNNILHRYACQLCSQGRDLFMMFLCIAVHHCSQTLCSLNACPGVCPLEHQSFCCVRVDRSAGMLQQYGLEDSKGNPIAQPGDLVFEETGEFDGASASGASYAIPVSEHGDSKKAFANHLLSEMRVIGKKCGGPLQYLLQEMPSNKEKAVFVKWLWETFPEQDDTYYNHGLLESVRDDVIATSTPLCIHIAALGFHQTCSLKPSPGQEVFNELLEQFVVDGFVTAGDPLLVNHCVELVAESEAMDQMWSAPAGQPLLGVCSLGYTKGMARATSVLALLHYCFKHTIDLQALHPRLHRSVLMIWVYHVKFDSKIDEGIHNMKISSRGSIRKMTNVIQTTVLIQNLFKYGLTDFGVFVRKWNQQSGRSHQIVGKRALSLKLLFEHAPLHVLADIVRHVGTVGWQESCWSDDNLASKKIYPKFQFPSKSKKWLPRIRTSDHSMFLMISRAQHVAERSPPYMRKKLEATCVEAMAERAAAAWEFARELQTHLPIPDAQIEEAWLGPWSRGSEHVDTEIQAVLLEKADSFNIMLHLPTLRKLVDEHSFSSPVKVPVTESDALEVDAFNLLLKQLEYDTLVFENWEKKCSNVWAARYHAEQAFKVGVRAKLQQNAEAFLSACVKLTIWTDKVEEAIAEVMNYKRDVAQKFALKHSDVPAVVFMNWAAPCIIPALQQDHHIGLLAWALHDNMQSCCLAVSPVFSYQRGRVYLEEAKMMKELSKGNHNLDTSFSLLFKEQCDARDQRPMVYPGRLVFPSPLIDLKKNMFYHSDLRKLRRTEEVAQLNPSSMKEVEDLSADALPPSTDSRIGVAGAQKYAQLGCSGVEALLAGVMSGVNFERTNALVMIDLHASVGDAVKAFCNKRGLFGTSFFYIGFCENQTELDWLQTEMLEVVTTKLQDGVLNLPFGDKVDKTMSEDLLEPLPPLPRMNKLVVGGPEKNILQVPTTLVKEWQFHKAFGPPFMKWLDKFCERYTVVDAASDGLVEKNPLKRCRDVILLSPAAKKPKIATECVIEANSITDALLLETRMTGKDNLAMIQIRSGHKIYLVNNTPVELVIPADAFIAGFGKGSFKLLKQGVDVDPNHLEFVLHNEDHPVVFNGVVVPVGKVVMEQRLKKTDAQVAYHKLEMNLQDPHKFVLTQTHKIAFVSKDEGAAELAASTIGMKEEVSVWNSQCLQVLWNVRWTAKGLMPVKPSVHLKGNLNLLAGRACHANL